jgi:hypothetical protein
LLVFFPAANQFARTTLRGEIPGIESISGARSQALVNAREGKRLFALNSWRRLISKRAQEDMAWFRDTADHGKRLCTIVPSRGVHQSCRAHEFHFTNKIGVADPEETIGRLFGRNEKRVYQIEIHNVCGLFSRAFPCESQRILAADAIITIKLRRAYRVSESLSQAR